MSYSKWKGYMAVLGTYLEVHLLPKDR